MSDPPGLSIEITIASVLGSLTKNSKSLFSFSTILGADIPNEEYWLLLNDIAPLSFIRPTPFSEVEDELVFVGNPLLDFNVILTIANIIDSTMAEVRTTPITPLLHLPFSSFLTVFSSLVIWVSSLYSSCTLVLLLHYHYL